MPTDYAAIDEMKRKLRMFKKHELRIRFGNTKSPNSHQKRSSDSLVWDEFFDLKNSHPLRAKYSIGELVVMGREEFKDIVNEFFFDVYYRYYRENGMVNMSLYNPEILTQMGLSPYASYEDIKKRFRELAKKCHPDTGGDSAKFMELMENYRKLMDEN